MRRRIAVIRRLGASALGRLIGDAAANKARTRVRPYLAHPSLGGGFTLRP